MSMKTVKLTELDEAVRSFLDQAQQGDGIRVEDAEGEPCYSVAPFYRAGDQERQQALARLAEIQRKQRERMEAEGKTEEQLDEILQEEE